MPLLDRDSDGEGSIDSYFRTIRIRTAVPIVLIVVATVMLFFSFSSGKYDLGLTDAIRLVFDRILNGESDSYDELVVWKLKVPRGMMALFAGAALATGGAIMQSMLNNPLADPYTTGVSSGASLGVSLAVVEGITLFPFLGDDVSLVVNAFVMSLVPASIIVVLSAVKKITSTMMILIGIGVMYIFSAVTQLLKLIATPGQLQQIYMWQLGSMSWVTLHDVYIVMSVTVVCIAVLYLFRSHLNHLLAGDSCAITLGTNPWKLRVFCLVVISLLTSVTVSFCGTIGFVGLVAPQIVRVLIGSDNRYLIPSSAAFGGFFLLLADCIARNVGDTGVPVGVVTAVIGSPLFLYLLIKQNRRHVI